MITRRALLSGAAAALAALALPVPARWKITTSHGAFVTSTAALRKTISHEFLGVAMHGGCKGEIVEVMTSGLLRLSTDAPPVCNATTAVGLLARRDIAAGDLVMIEDVNHLLAEDHA